MILSNSLPIKIIFLLPFTIFIKTVDYPFKGIVNVCVADLRAEPIVNSATLPTSSSLNPLQITQLLLNEHIIAHEETIDTNGTKWLRINTLQQEYYFEPLEWHGYPGWIQADHITVVDEYPIYNIVISSYLADLLDENLQPMQKVSIGTRFYGTQISESIWQITLPAGTVAYLSDSDVYKIDTLVQESIQQLRNDIVMTAKKFLGNWYSWGGRSAQYDEFGISSVDCSAMVNLSFMAHGLQLPRMSHEQFLRSEKVEYCKDLQPGDLIFFSSVKKQSMRMDHVMMFLGDNMLIESTIAGKHKTRIVSFQQRMGQACRMLQHGDLVEDNGDLYIVFFGSFFNDPVLLQSLRNDAINNIYSQDFINKRNFCSDLSYCKYH